jgi:hypothetical protein
MVHVPYKGGGQQLTDALSGQFELLSINAGPTLTEHIKSGKLRPLAVGAPKRLDSLPSVPTLAELGYPRANLSSQFGVFAPGKLPDGCSIASTARSSRRCSTRTCAIACWPRDNVPTGGTSKEFARKSRRSRKPMRKSSARWNQGGLILYHHFGEAPLRVACAQRA